MTLRTGIVKFAFGGLFRFDDAWNGRNRRHLDLAPDATLRVALVRTFANQCLRPLMVLASAISVHAGRVIS
jgi:hypothetical protein